MDDKYVIPAGWILSEKLTKGRSADVAKSMYDRMRDAGWNKESLVAEGYLIHPAMHTESSVASPTHYTQGYLETIYVIEQTLGKDGFKAFCMGNWIKYRERHAHKNGAEDLAKAEQYLDWAVNGLPKPDNGMIPR